MSERQTTPVTQQAADELRERVEGNVILPGDGNYDEARMAWNLVVDQRPAVILQASSAADVVEGVRFARAEGLGIAVQATGHGVALPANDCLLIVTAGLQGVRVDADAQTAWVAAGVQWGAVLEKAQEVGLAPLLGSSPGVGVVGYTLGGGLGWLARKYGVAADSVLAFEVVTADGELRRASSDENADLFWALRGGGGAFGVITAIEITLYPVATVYGGWFVYPPTVVHEAFARYRDWIADMPEEMTTSIRIMNFPDLPMVPEPMRGKSAVMVLGCYAGPVEEGEALVQTWRDWMPPIMDTFRVMPFSEVASISSDPEGPLPAHATGMWLSGLDDEVVETLVRYGLSVNGSTPILQTEVRHVGGHLARNGSNGGAYDARDASLLLELVSLVPSGEAFMQLEEFTEAFKQALAPYAAGRAYLNFLEGQERWDRTREAYAGETYERLMAIKTQVDPDNLLRYSVNIPPASGERE